MKLKDNSTQEIDTALYQLEQKLKSNIRLTDVENSNASTAKINAVDKKLTEEVKDRQSADEKLQDNILLDYSSDFLMDSIMCTASAVLLLLLILNRDRKLTRWGGTVMLAVYAGYFISMVL